MISVRKFILAGFVVVTGAIFAQAAATDPDVIARQDLMKTQGGAARTLGEMASGKTAYDAAAAQAAKDALMSTSIDIEAKYTKQTNDPEQESKAEIWTNWEDFLLKAKALNDAATAMDVSSPATIGAGMAGVGAACSACHQAYRL